MQSRACNPGSSINISSHIGMRSFGQKPMTKRKKKAKQKTQQTNKRWEVRICRNRNGSETQKVFDIYHGKERTGRTKQRGSDLRLASGISLCFSPTPELLISLGSRDGARWGGGKPCSRAAKIRAQRPVLPPAPRRALRTGSEIHGLDSQPVHVF